MQGAPETIRKNASKKITDMDGFDDRDKFKDMEALITENRWFELERSII
jgi:hypothetical protein